MQRDLSDDMKFLVFSNIYGRSSTACAHWVWQIGDNSVSRKILKKISRQLPFFIFPEKGVESQELCQPRPTAARPGNLLR
jgi:hypothetical protein